MDTTTPTRHEIDIEDVEYLRHDGQPLLRVVDAPGLTFIPYHTWGNRGLATMRVWVPQA